mmetsp:Transcript_35582/g.56941  ORF Transcript_35582/g.56941 Transcript_35582/m.56941 type:complete len:698 (+) Transcript_35582:399-2492(+)
MGAGSSALKKGNGTTIPRQPQESSTRHRIRVKFQQHGLVEHTGVNLKIIKEFGDNPRPVGEVLDILSRLSCADIPMSLVKTVFGSNKNSITREELGQFIADISYNPSIGAVWWSLLGDSDKLTDHGWDIFLTEFQGIADSRLAMEKEFLSSHLPFHFPSMSHEFARYICSDINSAFKPALQKLQRYDRPLSEYFIKVGNVIEFSGAEGFERLIKCVTDGSRLIKLDIHGGAQDGKPRVLQERYPEGTPLDSLPSFVDVVTRLENAIASVYETKTLDTYCYETKQNVGRMPLLLMLEFYTSCDEGIQNHVCDSLQEVFGQALDTPKQNENGLIWSPIQLAGKIVIVAPHTLREKEPAVVAKGEDPPTPVPLSKRVLDMISFRMVTVAEIRPILDMAKSRADLKFSLQQLVLTLTPLDVCVHITELSSITDMLLVYVQTGKRRKLMKKKSNLVVRNNEEYERLKDQDTRFAIEFSELDPAEVVTVACSDQNKGPILVDTQDFVEPLRGWRYGAQIIPVDANSHLEFSLLNTALFKQNANGFVAKSPMDMFQNHPNFTNLFESFNPDYARSLFVTVLSANRIPRDGVCTEPYVKIECNNGTGLKQVAITSSVEDNGYVCTWEEDFEFKFHIADLNSSACLLFTIGDRKELQGGELAFAAVPIWGLQTGYRNLQVCKLDGTPVEDSKLIVHFDWEADCDDM